MARRTLFSISHRLLKEAVACIACSTLESCQNLGRLESRQVLRPPACFEVHLADTLSHNMLHLLYYAMLYYTTRHYTTLDCSILYYYENYIDQAAISSS